MADNRIPMPGALQRVPKVYPVIHVTGVESAAAEVARASRHPIDGVFLIDHDADDERLVSSIRAVIDHDESLFVGVNFIRRSLSEALDILGSTFGENIPIDAIWADSVPALAPGHSDELLADRRGWHGLHFGGVAFKYQAPVALEDLPALGEAALAHMEVVTTSGPGTGQAADRSRLQALRSGIGDAPLALASGVTPENVHSYLGLVDHVLVATGIARPEGGIDEAKLSDLLAKVR